MKYIQILKKIKVFEIIFIYISFGYDYKKTMDFYIHIPLGKS